MFSGGSFDFCFIVVALSLLLTSCCCYWGTKIWFSYCYCYTIALYKFFWWCSWWFHALKNCLPIRFMFSNNFFSTPYISPCCPQHFKSFFLLLCKYMNTISIKICCLLILRIFPHFLYRKKIFFFVASFPLKFRYFFDFFFSLSLVGLLISSTLHRRWLKCWFVKCTFG